MSQMSCPDLSALARVGTRRADPSVVEHLRTCDSCWMDWQIQQGARLFHHSSEDRHGVLHPNASVMAEISFAEQLVDDAPPAAWNYLAVSGLLIAAAALTFFLTPMNSMDGIPIGHAIAYAAASGIAGAVYCWRRDRTESPDRTLVP